MSLAHVWSYLQILKKWKNTEIHSSIISHTNCFKSLLVAIFRDRLFITFTSTYLHNVYLYIFAQISHFALKMCWFFRFIIHLLDRWFLIYRKHFVYFHPVSVRSVTYATTKTPAKSWLQYGQKYFCSWSFYCYLNHKTQCETLQQRHGTLWHVGWGTEAALLDGNKLKIVKWKKILCVIL